MIEEKYENVIESKYNIFDFRIKELLKCRDLIFLFVKRNFISQYKQTILGPAWAVIQPLFYTIIFSFVFGNIAGLGSDGVPNFIFYLSGNLLWAYFSGCFINISNSIISNGSMLSKVYFNRLVMPVSNIFSNLISFSIQFIMFIGFYIYFIITKQGIEPNLYILMFPLLLLQLAMLSLGTGLIVAILGAKYRDLLLLVPFIVELWKYLSPIAYDMFKLKIIAPNGILYNWYMLNPVTPIINMFRYGFLGIGTIDWTFYLIGWIWTLLILIFGILLFNYIGRKIVDLL